jgi:drug/metabolite transporter (DMT)-like permease
MYVASPASQYGEEGTAARSRAMQAPRFRSKSPRRSEPAIPAPPAAAARSVRFEPEAAAKPEAADASGWQVVPWLALFMCSSVGITISNKAITHQFPYFNFLLVVQSSVTVGIQVVGWACGFIDMKPWRLEHFRQWMLVSFSFTLVLTSSLLAMPHVAIATTLVFRNIALLLVALGDHVQGNRAFSSRAKAGLAAISFGSAVYASTDIQYSPIGYMWLTVNTVLYAITVHLEKYASVNTDQTYAGNSCYQNICSLPVSIALMVLGVACKDGPVGEYISDESGALSAFAELSLPYKATVLGSGVIGCCLSMACMRLNKITVATNVAMANNVNKLVSAVVGMLVFKTAMKPSAVVGLLIVLFGASVFGAEPKTKPIGSKKAK